MIGVDIWVDSHKAGTLRLNDDGETLSWIGDKPKMEAVIDPLQHFHQGIDLLRYLLSHSGTYTQYLPAEEGAE